MFPFAQVQPDPRLMERLAGRLRGTSNAATFRAAGEALALAVLGSRGGGTLPAWAETLANAMVGSLLLVQDATMDDSEPADRVGLAQAAAVLSVVRPRAAGACDAAISIWMAWGLGAPRFMDSSRALASRTLIALYLDDTTDAADAVTALLDLQGDGIGLILHDWTVARVQQHGLQREQACFRNLCIAARSSRLTATDPGLLVLGALVQATRESPRRDHVLEGLDALVGEGRDDVPATAQRSHAP